MRTISDGEYLESKNKTILLYEALNNDDYIENPNVKRICAERLIHENLLQRIYELESELEQTKNELSELKFNNGIL